MSYRIEYAPLKNKKSSKRFPVKRMLGIALVLILFITVIPKLSRQESLLQLLLPGDPQVTQEALSLLIAQLREGIPFQQALTVFCQQIVDGAAV